MSFEYKNVIDEIFETYSRRRAQLPKNIKTRLSSSVVDNTKRINLDYDRYAHVMYQAVLQFFGKKNNSLAFSRYIYESILQNNKADICTYDIVIYPMSRLVEYGDDSTRARYGPKRNKIDDSKYMTDFYEYILEKTKPCRFSVIFVTLVFPNGGAHADMIFVENLLDTENTIVFNYYEPHGYEKLIGEFEMLDFLEDLQKASNNVIYVEYKLTEELGSQLYSKDDTGYCVMFSLFWIYVVLNIVMYNLINNTYEVSVLWIDKVEKYYIEKMESKKLYEIVVTFAIELFNNTIENFSTKDQEIIWRYIGKRLTEDKHVHIEKNRQDSRYYIDQYLNPERDFYRDYLYGTENKEDKEEKSYSNKELESDPELSYEAWQKAVNAEKRLIRAWKSFKNPLGTMCNQDEDCFSDRCVRDPDGNYCSIKR